MVSLYHCWCFILSLFHSHQVIKHGMGGRIAIPYIRRHNFKGRNVIVSKRMSLRPRLIIQAALGTMYCFYNTFQKSFKETLNRHRYLPRKSRFCTLRVLMLRPHNHWRRESCPKQSKAPFDCLCFLHKRTSCESVPRCWTF